MGTASEIRSQSPDKATNLVFFKHVRKIHKYLQVLELAYKKKHKNVEYFMFSKSLDKLSAHIKENYIEGSKTNGGTSVLSGFSEISGIS